MQANNLQQEQACMTQSQPTLSVLPLGLGVMIEEKLKQLFQSSRPNGRSYCLAPPNSPHAADIILVNYDNVQAVQKQQLLLAGHSPYAQVVAISQGPLATAPHHHIRGMLTASRLFSVLDNISVYHPAPSTAFVPPTLELVQVAPKSQIVPTPSLAAGAAPRTNGYRALVVDDSLSIQKSLELKLIGLAQIAGIDFADSGESALAKAATQSYDLIFLDVMMPGIDGYETCTQLRKRPEYKKTPIIMVSGKTSPLDEVKGVMAGCTTYLTKPVQDEAFNKLSLRVLAWLADRKPT